MNVAVAVNSKSVERFQKILFFSDSLNLFCSMHNIILGCISLAKPKNGLLREITRILFCQRNKESEKGLIADSFPRKKRKIYDFSAKTACHMYFFRILSQRNAKATNPKNPDSD